MQVLYSRRPFRKGMDTKKKGEDAMLWMLAFATEPKEGELVEILSFQILLVRRDRTKYLRQEKKERKRNRALHLGRSSLNVSNYLGGGFV